MKILLNGKKYTEEDGPLVVYLTDNDKKNISNMGPDNLCYMVYENDIMTENEAREYITEAKRILNDEKTGFIQIPLHDKLLEEFLGESNTDYNRTKIKTRIYDYINEKYNSVCRYVYSEILSDEDKRNISLVCQNELDYFMFTGDRKTKMFFNDLIVKCENNKIDIEFDFKLGGNSYET